MPTESIRVDALIPASPERIYAAWLSSDEHTKMTNATAEVDPTVGGKHSAWDGYISGTSLELEPSRRIVQSWRAEDFPEGSGDSRLVVLLEPEGDGTRVTIEHDDVPEGHGARFRSGWESFYFAPMTAYFGAP